VRSRTGYRYYCFFCRIQRNILAGTVQPSRQETATESFARLKQDPRFSKIIAKSQAEAKNYMDKVKSGELPPPQEISKEALTAAMKTEEECRKNSIY